jgi:thiamine-phosphate diphosphorylase / hydroxyethylthiazole kinase
MLLNHPVMELSNADGIHVGQSDEALEIIKKKIKPSKIIGVTVNSVEQADKAIKLGADYLGTDAVFPSITKPGNSMGIEKLREIALYSQVPIVGIGGIHKDNVNKVMDASVSGVAVSSAILNSNSMELESNSLKSRINKHQEDKLRVKIAECFEKIKIKSPLIHNITNNVVMNQTANGLISIGGSPIMSEAIEEMEDLVSISNALNVNIGTLTKSQIESILVAGRKANEIKVPVTLDPVGVGASNFRKEMTLKLLNSIRFSIIKGNQSEIAFLYNQDQKQKGVDSIASISNIAEIVKSLSRKYNGTVFAATGRVDTISNGNQVVQILNESDMLGKITGTGCLVGALVSCFSSVTDDHLVAACGGIALMNIAAEQSKFSGSYSFKAALMDQLSILTPDDLLQNIKIKII